MREHLIPRRIREPRPIVNSGGAAGGGVRRSQKRVTEGIFLAKIFFLWCLPCSYMKRIASMDLARPPGQSRKIRLGVPNLEDFAFSSREICPPEIVIILIRLSSEQFLI